MIAPVRHHQVVKNPALVVRKKRVSLTEIEQPILQNALHNLRKHDITIPVDTRVSTR